MKLHALEPARTSEEVAQRVEDYFHYCQQNGLRAGIEGLCLALGCSRQALWNWSRESGQRGEAVRRAKLLISAQLEQWTISGKINPASGIFMLKNWCGYTDTQQIELARPGEIRPRESAEVIAARHADEPRPEFVLTADDLERIQNDPETLDFGKPWPDVEEG